jgi:hypothetical protein
LAGVGRVGKFGHSHASISGSMACNLLKSLGVIHRRGAGLTVRIHEAISQNAAWEGGTDESAILS